MLYEFVKNIFRPRTQLSSSRPLTETHRRAVEFALVLVDVHSDQQMQWTLGVLTEEAKEYGGTVLQILGPLVFIAFDLFPSVEVRRIEFVNAVSEQHRHLVRILHGRCCAMVGTVGSAAHRSYTVIPDDFSSLLTQFAQLKSGEHVEYLSEK